MLKALIPDNTVHKLNGRPVSRKEWLRRAKGIAFGEEALTPEPSCWPLKSDAMKVHPADVREATEYARQLGVPTEYRKDGRPVFTSQGHRKRFCEAHGFYDRNGGYGDPQRK